MGFLGGIMNNTIIQYVIVLAVMAIFVTLSILASVSASLGSSLTTMGTLTILVAIAWIFGSRKSS